MNLRLPLWGAGAAAEVHAIQCNCPKTEVIQCMCTTR